MKLKHLTIAMAKDNFRQFEIVFWTIVFPAAMFIFFTTVFSGAFDQETSELNLKIGVVYEETLTGTTKEIFGELFKGLEEDDSNTFNITYFDKSDNYLEELRARNLDVIIFFPEGFNRLNLGFILQNIEVPDIKILHTSRSISTLGRDILNSIMDEVNLRINTFGQDVEMNIQKVSLSSKEGVDFNYLDFIFPSMLIMAIMTVSFFNMPLSIVDYSSQGISKRISITPAKKTDYFFAFLISQFFVLILSIILLYFMSRFYNISKEMYSLKFFGFLLFSILTSLSFGLLFASFFKKISTLSAVTNVMYFLTMFLSGLYFDVSNIPMFLRWYTLINPMTYLVNGMRNILNLKSLEANMIIIPLIWFFVGIIVFSYNLKKVKE